MLLLIILGIGYLLIDYFFPAESNETTQLNEEDERPAPSFEWRFEEADSLNPDGGNQTNIYLAVNNEDKLIDTVDGSCSELEGEKYEGDVSDTGKVQCYYAGLGQNYRITKNEDAYLVERKFIEEGLPDIVPPPEEWEIIEQFNF